MAELINIPEQEIEAGENAQFTVFRIRAPWAVLSAGAGLVSLKHFVRGCATRYRISFNGNIAVPADGTPGPISMAISVNGETLGNTEAIVTPTAAEAYFNVHGEIMLDAVCCVTVGLRNTSDQTILLQNAELMIDFDGNGGGYCA